MFIGLERVQVTEVVRGRPLKLILVSEVLSFSLLCMKPGCLFPSSHLGNSHADLMLPAGMAENQAPWGMNLGEKNKLTSLCI